MKHLIDTRIILDEKQYALYKSGQTQLMALGKQPKTNQIQFHAPITGKGSNSVTAKGILIGVGIAAVLAGVSILVYIGAKTIKEKKYLKEHPETALSLEYNSAMTNYLQKAQNTELSFKDIKRLTDCFDTIIKERNAGNVTIEVSEEEMKTLYSIIYKITKQIPEEKMIPIDEKHYALDVFENDSSDIKMEKMRDLLMVQEKVVLQK